MSFPIPAGIAETRGAIHGWAHADGNTVIIIRSRQIAAYNEAMKGFEEGCEGKNISIRARYDLQGDAAEWKRVMQQIKNDDRKPGLILAIGVLAATLAKSQFTDIPVIFCMVINHKRFNLQGANVTGISSETAMEDLFVILKEILGTRKNVGVIYDQTKTGGIVSDTSAVAEKFRFNLIKIEVLSEKRVPYALKNNIKNIDALWIVPDGTVVTKDTLSKIFKKTLKSRLPTFCTSSAIVKAGAFISISPNYRYVGLQAAQLAQTLLNEPTKASLGIQQPEKVTLTVNTQTAKMLGIDLSSIKSRNDIVLYP